MNKYTEEDLVDAAIQHNPTEFENIFNDMIIDRIRDSIVAKKVEIAQSLYNYEPPEPPPEPDYEENEYESDDEYNEPEDIEDYEEEV